MLLAVRVAVTGQLWPVALVLSHSLGADTLSETVTAMATSALCAGSPLKTLVMIMGGAPDALLHTGANPSAAPTTW